MVDPNSYEGRYRAEMDGFYPNLWAHLELVPTLEKEVGLKVLRLLLELACQAQNIRNIEIGRRDIQLIPRDWLIENIEEAAEFLDEVQDDDWEYNRLGEVYRQLDDALLRRHIERGLAMENREIQEAARDFEEYLRDKAAD